MKFITLLFIFACSLFANEHYYTLMGVSANEMKIVQTYDANSTEKKIQTFNINLTLGKEYENYRYSLNLVAKNDFQAFIAIDYLQESMIAGDTKAFIGLLAGRSKIATSQYANGKNSDLSNWISGVQLGFTAYDFEIGYRFIYINNEYTNNNYTEELKYLHSAYIAAKF